MELLSYYLQLLSELCEGKRPLPEGIELTEQDPTQRAVELQQKLSAGSVTDFLRQCAAEDGKTFSDDELASFDLRKLLPQSEPEQPPVQTEIRDIYEVFLDSVCLEDRFLQYLIDVLKRRDKEEFQKLTQIAARSHLDMDDFLAWLGNKHLIAPEEEQICVLLMDKCLQRLANAGQTELIAALLSGDETTFSLFRCEAEELKHLPEATYDWFCTNYLDKYYPVRFLMRYHSVEFPEA